MASALASFVALFAAVFFLLMGTGLLGTLLSLRMAISGLSAQVTGWVMAAYFAGLVIGSFTCQRLVQRVGHVRSFAAFAAVTTATVMLHGLYFSAFFWGILRFLTGITSMGLYMVIESWLNECAEAHTRGRVFSIYMVLGYLGMGTGQLLLNAGDVRGQELFLITGIFLALCLVPVAVTSSVHPKMSKTVSFNLADLMQRAPLGMLGCLSAGLINGAFYALGPVFSNQIGLTDAQVAWFMTSTIFGGLILQWPVGALSDRFDRTLVLPILAVAMRGRLRGYHGRCRKIMGLAVDGDGNIWRPGVYDLSCGRGPHTRFVRRHEHDSGQFRPAAQLRDRCQHRTDCGIHCYERP